MRFATVRERSADERRAMAVRLARLASDERVLLETCHRVELISVDDLASDGRMASGADAIRRVFEVVAGFDSAVVAEEQLLGQARDAYEAALADGTAGPILNELFRRVLRFGRRVRSHARPGTDRSLADRGGAWLLDGRTAVGDRVLVAGTGEMGRLSAMRVAAAGRAVTIVSRTPERGGRLLEGLPGAGHRLSVGPLSREDVGTAAALILAVRAPSPVLTPAELATARPWTVDLSMPAAVDPDAATLLGARLLSLDRLGQVSGSAPILAPAIEARLRRELNVEVDRFVAWLDVRASADALALLHGSADAVRRRHLDRLRGRAQLAPEQLAAVEVASAAMLGELLHRPYIELRRGGADAATVRRLFGLER